MIILSDIHVHNYLPYAKTTSFIGINTRAKICLDVLEFIFKKALKEKHNVVIAGDLFISRDILDISVGVATYKLLSIFGKLFRDNNLKIIFIMGNHDRYSKAVDASSVLTLFKNIPGLRIIMKAEVILISEFNKQKKLACVPCRDNNELLYEDILKLKGKANTLITHTPLFHARISDKYKLEDGLKIKGIKRFFKWGFYGDIHKYQKVGDNHYIIGSPIQHTFGDEGDKRGYIKVVHNKIKFVTLNNLFPEFHTIIQSTSKIKKVYVKKIDYIKYISNDMLPIVQKNKVRRLYKNIEILELNNNENSKKSFKLKNLKFNFTDKKQIIKQYLKWNLKNTNFKYENKKLNLSYLLNITSNFDV